jgi:hypothetical protein
MDYLERAKAVATKAYHPQDGVDMFNRYCEDLAAAFEDVAQEARREQLAELTAEVDAVFALARVSAPDAALYRPFAGKKAKR